MQQKYHYKKNDVNVKKVENVYQKRPENHEVFKSLNAAGFVELCHKSSIKKLNEENLQMSSTFTKPSKIFNL